MKFAQPIFLWLLLIAVPALSVFLFFAWRTKQKLISQFVQSRLLANLTVGVSKTRQKARLVLLAVSFFLAILVLARPQWGFDWEEAKQQGLDIMIAIDTSKSMLATDVTPSRLGRSKLAAFDLMKLAKSDRLGLIAFAGSAFVQCPLTLDEEAFRQSVDALDVNIIPQGGTAISEAIDTARDALEKSGEHHKVLILFTDGEDHDSGAEAAAEKAQKAGVKIFTIGVGSAQGELIRVRDEQGNEDFLKDSDGNVVKSHLNESLLQTIATKADGFYLPLRGVSPVESLYQQGLAPLLKGNLSTSTQLIRNYREQFKWPLIIAIILLILEMFLPQRMGARRSEGAAGKENGGLKKVVALLLLSLLPLAGFASPSSALKKYQAGKFDDALQDYEKSLEGKTNDFRLYFNAGDAAYRAKKYEDAKALFDTAISCPELKLQQQAYYNLGNTLYQLGETIQEPDKKKELWGQAVRHYESALKLNSQDLDAKANLAFVKQKIEELKKDEQKKPDDNKKPDPSAAAKKAKEAADEAVRQRQYKKALDIMEESLKQDETTDYYSDYIQRLKEVNGIQTKNPNQH